MFMFTEERIVFSSISECLNTEYEIVQGVHNLEYIRQSYTEQMYWDYVR